MSTEGSSGGGGGRILESLKKHLLELSESQRSVQLSHCILKCIIIFIVELNSVPVDKYVVH